MSEELIKFPSNEWIQRFMEEVNASKAYEEAAKTWEGDFVFIIDANSDIQGLEKDQMFYVDLWHGKCRTVEYLPPGTEKDAEFIWSGPYENWQKLIQGELDPLKGLMMRKFKLKGNTGKIMRAVNAAKELVNCVAKVPTEFL